MRDVVKKQILDVFQEQSKFNLLDFSINMENGEIEFTYKHNKIFQLIAKFDGRAFRGETCPGTITMSEPFTALNVRNFKDIIISWFNLIWEELTVAPQCREFFKEKLAMEEKFNELLKNLKLENENSYFSREEGEKFKEQLNSIEEILEKQAAENKSLKETLEKMIQEIENLKEVIYSIPKINVAKKLFSRIAQWTPILESTGILIDKGIQLIEYFSK